MHTTPRFYQKSTLLKTNPSESDIYQYGPTELIILGEKTTFPNGIKVPHEIFHLYTMELSQMYGYPEYPFFSNSDEITSDYLEEIFTLAKEDGGKLVFELDSIDRPISEILDCSIVFLQLDQRHQEIAKMIQLDLPKYSGWKTSKSHILKDLKEYEVSGVMSDALMAIEKTCILPLGDTWAKYIMAAHFGKQMFNLLLRDWEVAVNGNDLILTVKPTGDYLHDIYRDVVRYKQAFDLNTEREVDYVEFSLD